MKRKKNRIARALGGLSVGPSSWVTPPGLSAIMTTYFLLTNTLETQSGARLAALPAACFGVMTTQFPQVNTKKEWV